MKDINKKPKLKTPVVLQGCVSIPTATLLDEIAMKFGLNTSAVVRDACVMWAEKYKDVMEYNDNDGIT